MFTRVLGRSGIEVSALGMGCWAIGGPWSILREDGPTPAGWGRVDDAESVRTIHAALEAGVTFFDTAANYGCGHSERILGKALKGRRSAVVVATKFGHVIDEEKKVVRGDDDAIVGNVRHDCEASLRRLGTDYIDLYQLHAGNLAPERAAGVLDELEKLVADGKIRAYGWSTDDADRARVFAEGAGCAAIQFSLSVLQNNAEMLALCAERDLGCVTKKPLSSGFLTGKFTPETTFPEDDFRRAIDFASPRFAGMLTAVDALRDVLSTGGRTMAQGALAWVWARSDRTVPIPGARSVEQIRENAGAMERGPLTPDQLEEVSGIVAGIRTRLGDAGAK